MPDSKTATIGEKSCSFTPLTVAEHVRTKLLGSDSASSSVVDK